MEESSQVDDQNHQQISEVLIHIPMETSDDNLKEEHLVDDHSEIHEELEIVKLEPKSAKKRVSLTIEKKIEIINRHEKGETQRSLAQEFNVGRTTICDILKRKYKFFKFMSMNADKTENLKRRRTLRRTVHKELENKLLEWYNEIRERGSFVSGPMIAQKAQEYHKELGYTDNFSASNGWLDRFKVRNGIKLCGLREVRTESDENAVGPFKSELESLAQWYNLSLEQVYNADETDLFWKMLPNPESDLNEVKASVRAYRERMTVLCCSNATGSHKLPLVCIGRGKKSRTFTSHEIKMMPVSYYSQETAWMDNEIFKNWFHSQFVPSVREHLRSIGLPETAILLIDRNPSHPNDQHLRSEDNFFFVQYFPPKVKTLVQPMEQGLIRDMKLHYRYELLIELINKNLSINDFHKQLSIKDAIRLIADSWNAITPENVQRCFSKIFPLPDGHQSFESTVPTAENFMDLIKKIPECEMNGYSRDRLEYWLNCDEAEPKKDCNAFFGHNPDESIVTVSKDDQESVKVFESFSEEIPQTIEIITTAELQQSTAGNLISDDDILHDDEEVVLLSQTHDEEVQFEREISEDNILYEETENDVTCKQALDALGTVLRFMKNDSESRYRDVVFLSELKKKLRNRLHEVEGK
ncbi:jerky protein homolog-like [Chironomus tepperi]|uniref:jerky protein homolog-like n=1 Tax=Chironomus tepperi TaxID=113505 RepID=UPI00391F0A09